MCNHYFHGKVTFELKEEKREQINRKKQGNKKKGERVSKKQNTQEDVIQIINNKEKNVE